MGHRSKNKGHTVDHRSKTQGHGHSRQYTGHTPNITRPSLPKYLPHFPNDQSCAPNCWSHSAHRHSLRQHEQQLQQQITSHGIKRHGDSIAASCDSVSAISAFWSRTGKCTRVTPKPRWSINISDLVRKLF